MVLVKTVRLLCRKCITQSKSEEGCQRAMAMLQVRDCDSLTKGGDCQETNKDNFVFLGRNNRQPYGWVRGGQAVQQSGIKDTMRCGIWTTE